jgi:hypothetical protein
MKKTFKFMSQTWHVKAAEPGELIDCLGQCDPRTNTILVDPNLPTDVLLQTFFHEMVHCWEITLNLCLTEQQVDVLATAMIHCFRENPELLELFEQGE